MFKTSTQHQPSLVCNVKHRISVDFSASVNVPSIVRPEKQFFQYEIWNGLKLKILSGKVYMAVYVIQVVCYYYFYSTMANTVVNGIHVKGMI